MNEILMHGVIRVREVLYSCKTPEQRENAAHWANGWIERSSRKYDMSYDDIFDAIFEE